MMSDDSDERLSTFLVEFLGDIFKAKLFSEVSLYFPIFSPKCHNYLRGAVHTYFSCCLVNLNVSVVL